MSRTISAPLRRRLLLVAAAGIVPLALAVAVGLAIIARNEWADAKASSLNVARISGAAIDLEIERSAAILRSMAASPLLDTEELVGTQTLLGRVLESTPSWHAITLASVDRRPLVHVIEPEGNFVTDGTETFTKVVETHTPIVGYLARDADGRWGIPLRMPVLRDGQLRYVLTAVLKPDAIRSALLAQRLPSEWLVSVFDARGNRIARTLNHDETIGGTPSPSLVQLLSAGGLEGLGITHSIEGDEVSTAYRRLPISGWTIVVGKPTAMLKAAAVQDFKLLGSGVLASLLIALVATWLAARSISRPMGRLRAAVEQIGRGELPQLPSSAVREVEEVGEALFIAVQRQRSIEASRTHALQALVAAEEGLRQQVSDLQRVHALSGDLLRETTLDGQLEAVLVALCELHHCRHGIVYLTDSEDNGLRAHIMLGFSDAAQQRLSCIRPGEGACGLSLISGRRMAVIDVGTHPLYADMRDLVQHEGLKAVHSTPIRSSLGRVLGVLTVGLTESRYPTLREKQFADLCVHLSAQVVERMLANKAASHSEQRLHIALDSASVPFSILSPLRDGRGLVTDFVWDYVNLAAAEMLQRPATDIIARRMREMTDGLWSDSGMFDAYVAVVNTGCAHSWEQAASAGRQWLHVVATPFSDKLAVWWSDITQRKQQEQRLREADRRKDEFIAILAHELRNPLAPIQQATRIAQSEASTEAQRRWSHDVIERQVRHMSKLLDDLLDISRITRGSLELRRARVDLQSVIDSAVETARPHVDARQHVLHVAPCAPRIFIDADPIRLAQVITNLLTNAARYTEPGGMITLSSSTDSGHVVVRVQDNGIGIPAKHIESIFEMFSQVHDKHDAPNSGLGIGLAFSRAVMELHGGTLTASSPGPDLGSSFELRLPLAAAPAVSLRLVKPAREREQLRVLIADDSRDAADTLAGLLRLEGHAVETAYDGEQACTLYERIQADVVLLDIGMPKLNGYQAASRIREISRRFEVRPLLVALTGWGQTQDREDARNAGFDRHLVKPVDPDLLLELIGSSHSGDESATRTA